jgi:fructose-1,6-bisphosphatase/inositol monophosphatase family enzyme
MCQERGFEVEVKPDGSLVTPVDKECEQKVRSVVDAKFPEHGFLGEEFGHTHPSSPWQWVIDPIDGTADFTRGMAQFGTVIAVCFKQLPFAGLLDFPALNLRLWAVYRQGLHTEGSVNLPRGGEASPMLALPPLYAAKRHGAEGLPNGEKFLHEVQQTFPNYRSFWTCLSYGYASVGAIDAAIELNCKLWDVASAEILAVEGGKEFTWLSAPSPWASGRCSSVVGAPHLVKSIVELWQRSQMPAAANSQ